jgi:hypothetical protein
MNLSAASSNLRDSTVRQSLTALCGGRAALSYSHSTLRRLWVADIFCARLGSVEALEKSLASALLQ